MILMKDGLYNIVNGTELPPTGGNELNKFNQRKDRALAIIVLAIDPVYFIWLVIQMTVKQCGHYYKILL